MIIGITGRVGSGKSRAAAVIEQNFECRVVDLDTIGHKVLDDPNAQDQLVAEFGTQILDASGKIDRKRLGTIAFSTKLSLEKLNQISHPILYRLALTEIKSAQKNTNLVIVVGALISELNLSTHCEHVLTIDATTEQIREKIGAKFDQASRFQRNRYEYQNEGHHVILNRFSSDFDDEVISFIKNLMTDLKSA